jgi:hypothetical protein
LLVNLDVGLPISLKTLVMVPIGWLTGSLKAA